MSIKKKFLKGKPVCKITFEVPKEIGKTAKSIHLVGDFNEWNPAAEPMKSTKEGKFSATIDLESGKEYQFRYLVDETSWINDADADKFVPTGFGDSDNSVVIV